MENSSWYQIRCLGGPESSKSAILDGKQLFISNSVFSGIFYFSDQNHGSFSKNPKWRPFEKDIFITRKGLFYMKNITKHHLKHILRKNEERNFPILGPKLWVNPFVINPKWRFLPKVYPHSLGRRILYQEHQNMFGLSWAKVKREKFSKFFIKVMCQPPWNFLKFVGPSYGYIPMSKQGLCYSLPKNLVTKAH